MFPVSLEDTKGQTLTYQPPCYGFLRQEEWEYESESGCDGLAVTFQHPYRCGENNPPDKPFGNQRLGYFASWNTSDRYIAMENLKAIWNSGTHMPFIGVAKDGVTPIAWERGSNLVYDKDELPPVHNNVDRWSEENPEYAVTTKEVMDTMEAWLDKDSEKITIWHEEGFMGADTTKAPADRVMFYLMFNRELNTPEYYSKTKTFLDNWLIKKQPPMVAFLMSRLIMIVQTALGERVDYSGNSGDSCILPDYLICKGLGKSYLEPVQINWMQEPYTSGEGHKRDEDLEELTFSHPEYSQEVSSSLFFAVFQLKDLNSGLELKTAPNEKAVPVAALFRNAVIPRQNQYFNSYISNLAHYCDMVESRKESLAPRKDWESIVFNILMDN